MEVIKLQLKDLIKYLNNDSCIELQIRGNIIRIIDGNFRNSMIARKHFNYYILEIKEGENRLIINLTEEDINE